MADETDTPDTTQEPGPTEVVVRPLAPRPTPWQSRALALRAALPQLARNPVVVGAAAAAATVAVRVAVDVARRAIGDTEPGGARTLEVTGRVLHEVHVERHVHVVHDVVHHVHHVHHAGPPPVALWLPVSPRPQ